MKRLRCLWVAGLGIFLALGLVAGCGKPAAPVVSVSGKVTVAGKSLTAGQVTFHPDVGTSPPKVKSKTPRGGPSMGEIKDGTYTIYTGGKSGAPLGKYKVTVTAPTMPAPEGKEPVSEIPEKYSNLVDTPLKIEVVADPKPGQYDLTLTK